MEKIKKCPFCKSDRVELLEKKSRGADGRSRFTYYVRCHKCHARGSTFHGCGSTDTWKQYAVAAWNSTYQDR